jgi:hypothetical protein
MGDLGDLGDFLKEGALADLSWLDVDEKKYREMEPLPMQNLDTAPDMEALWAHDDKPAISYKELDHTPQTMGDLSQAHGLLRTVPSDIIRTTRLAMMQSGDPTRIERTLLSRYDRASILNAKTALSIVLAERGLLGRFYIAAEDFPGCHNGQKSTIEFARKYAGEARYVLAKAECRDCVHAMQAVGKNHCSVFHKEIVVDIPYTEALAEDVESKQSAKGKAVQASQGTPKERIRLALLSEAVQVERKSDYKPVLDPATMLGRTATVEALPEVAVEQGKAKEVVGNALTYGTIDVAVAQQAYRALARATSVEDVQAVVAAVHRTAASTQRVYTGVGQQPVHVASQEEFDRQLIAVSGLTKKRDASVKRQVEARRIQSRHPIANFIRRELLKGRSEGEVVEGLKLSFTRPELESSMGEWAPMLKEAGIYGTLYSTQESFDDCREGADFLAKHNAGIKAIVEGPKCEGCVYNKMARCLLYGKSLAKEAADIQTWEVVQTVLHEHKTAGRIPAWDTRTAEWGQTPREALKAMHREASRKLGYAVAGGRLDAAVAAFRGLEPIHSTTTITKREILRKTARYLNEGLYGRDLLAALRMEFDPRDLTAATGDLRPLIAEQGLQGIYYVDPAVYEDYGRGCDEAARLFRAKGVPYVKVAPKCGSCVHQAQLGVCSKIGKPLVAEPPYIDKAEQQRAVLASGAATEVDLELLTKNNGLTMMAEYQLQHGGGLDIQLNPEGQIPPVDVRFTDASGIKL